MSKRVRLVGWNVQPVVMVDDGENLIPAQIPAQVIPAAAWEAFKNGGDEQVLAHVREQIAEQLGEQTAPAPAANGTAPNRAARRAKAPT